MNQRGMCDDNKSLSARVSVRPSAGPVASAGGAWGGGSSSLIASAASDGPAASAE